jgi:hypothetical protein
MRREVGASGPSRMVRSTTGERRALPVAVGAGCSLGSGRSAPDGWLRAGAACYDRR